MNIINGTPAAETITGTEGDDIIDGMGGQDTIFGLGGNDEIVAMGSFSMIFGGDGDDTITTGALSTVEGGDGDDFIQGTFVTGIGGAGADTIGGSFSAASYIDSPTGITASVNDPTQNTGFAANDVYLNDLQRLIGSNFDDVLETGRQRQTLEGGLGDDILRDLGAPTLRTVQSSHISIHLIQLS